MWRGALLGSEDRSADHEVKLIAPAYIKPFVKLQKNDMADAEAICEAAQRPTMRFVQVKSDEQQADAAVFRVRDLLVRQRTQLINALRGPTRRVWAGGGTWPLARDQARRSIAGFRERRAVVGKAGA